MTSKANHIVSYLLLPHDFIQGQSVVGKKCGRQENVLTETYPQLFHHVMLRCMPCQLVRLAAIYHMSHHQ